MYLSTKCLCKGHQIENVVYLKNKAWVVQKKEIVNLKLQYDVGTRLDKAFWKYKP